MHCGRWSTDGKQIITGSDSGVFKVWDAKTGVISFSVR
jgi:WD40 repeat protein